MTLGVALAVCYASKFQIEKFSHDGIVTVYNDIWESSKAILACP